MHDELTARQRAISLRLAGQPVKHICSALGRCEAWFHRWWRRYLEAGPEGLYDRTRANHHVAQHISPELERTILSIRRRLQAHASPATRYSCKEPHGSQLVQQTEMISLPGSPRRARSATTATGLSDCVFISVIPCSCPPL